MELVLKTPKDQPPFIGILFETENEAATINKTYVNSYSMDTYQLLLDPSHKLYITLLSGIKRGEKYTVDYDLVKLLKFVLQTQGCKLYTFGHLFMKDGKLKIARTTANMSKWILNVNTLRIDNSGS